MLSFHIKLSWENSSLDLKKQRIYKSTSPFDESSLPEVYVELGPDVREFLDFELTELTTFYYMISSVGTVDKEEYSLLFSEYIPVLVDPPEITTQQFLIDENDVPYIKLGWSAEYSSGPMYIYKSQTPIDINNLPAVYATIPEGSELYEDHAGVVLQETYYYVIGITILGRQGYTPVAEFIGMAKPVFTDLSGGSFFAPSRAKLEEEWDIVPRPKELYFPSKAKVVTVWE